MKTSGLSFKIFKNFKMATTGDYSSPLSVGAWATAWVSSMKSTVWVCVYVCVCVRENSIFTS